MLYPAELRARRGFLYHRRAARNSRRDILLLAMGLAVLPRNLHAQEEVEVAEILRADAWRLGDGRVIRLASVAVPDLPATLEPAGRAKVAPLAEGGPLLLKGAGQADRYGRLLGTLETGQGLDLRISLLRAGLAVVRTGDEPEDDVLRLLAAEDEARMAGRGIWGELDQALVTPETVGGRIGRFALVEGVAVSVTPRWEATYLDFGPDWRTAFGIRIRKADLPRFLQAGLDPETLVGRKLRARGWPFLASGPMLELRDPLELQTVP